MTLKELIETANGNLNTEVRMYVVINEIGVRTTRPILRADFVSDDYGPILYVDNWVDYRRDDWKNAP
jgi:hypothetical protein